MKLHIGGFCLCTKLLPNSDGRLGGIFPGLTTFARSVILGNALASTTCGPRSVAIAVSVATDV